MLGKSKKTKKPTIEAETSVVSGSVNKVSKYKNNKKLFIATISLILLIIFITIVLFVLLVKKDNNNTFSNLKCSNPRTIAINDCERMISEAQEYLKNDIGKNKSSEETQKYYTEALSTLVLIGDNQKTVDYYKDKFEKNGITLTLDSAPWMAQELAEAKEYQLAIKITQQLIEDIKKQTNNSEVDKIYIENQINLYQKKIEYYKQISN